MVASQVFVGQREVGVSCKHLFVHKYITRSQICTLSIRSYEVSPRIF